MSDVLLIEAGNTHWQLARWQQGQAELLSRGRTFPQLCEQVQAAQPRAIAFASVRAPALTRDFVQWAEQQQLPLYWARPASSNLVTLCYEQPETLGVDRWLTLLAVAENAQPALIVDAGTAITADFITADGQHLGGWIAPGFFTMVESLLHKSERLRVAPQAPDTALGTCTEDAVYLGCRQAQQGFLETAINEATQRWQQGYALFLTGGGATMLNVPDGVTCDYRPQLVLDGLAVWLSQHIDA